MAVTDLGLSPEQFWRLTWYEWGMYCLKLYKDSKKMLAQRELSIDLTRHFMALFANSNKERHQTPFTPQDFLWRLSYDRIPEVDDRPLTWTEAKALLGSKIKKADGGN